MISYELARKLKENGLEGNFDTDTIILHPDCADMPNNCENSAHSSGDCYIIAQCPPTLEELIEACGIEIDTIKAPSERLPDGEHVHWVVYQKGNKEEMFVSVYLDEALALLWLALNEKKV